MAPTLPDLNAIHNPAPETSILSAWGDAVNAAIAALDQLIPVGGFMPMAMGTAPSDAWMLADGTAISRSLYPVLWNRIGTTYGPGDGSTTFNLPNLKGRVIVAQDENDAAFNLVGETGGAKTHQLTGAESGVPAHNHPGSTGNDSPGHQHIGAGGSEIAVFAAGSSLWVKGLGPGGGQPGDQPVSFTPYTGLPTVHHTHAVAVGNNSAANAAQGHNNLQPYMALPIFIRVQ